MLRQPQALASSREEYFVATAVGTGGERAVSPQFRPPAFLSYLTHSTCTRSFSLVLNVNFSLLQFLINTKPREDRDLIRPGCYVSQSCSPILHPSQPLVGS